MKEGLELCSGLLQAFDRQLFQSRRHKQSNYESCLLEFHRLRPSHRFQVLIESVGHRGQLYFYQILESPNSTKV